MAEELDRSGDGARPVGEQIHLPGPTYLPVIVAAGVTIIVVGVVLGWIFVAVGVVIVVLACLRWIRETREDVSELPLEH